MAQPDSLRVIGDSESSKLSKLSSSGISVHQKADGANRSRKSDSSKTIHSYVTENFRGMLSKHKEQNGLLPIPLNLNQFTNEL